MASSNCRRAFGTWVGLLADPQESSRDGRFSGAILGVTFCFRVLWSDLGRDII